MLNILHACHSSPVGGHHASDRTARKILQGTTGPLFIKTPMSLSWPMISVSDRGQFLNITRCR